MSETSTSKDDLEKAILAVRAARRLLAQESPHASFVEEELASLDAAFHSAHVVLVRALHQFEQLSPRAQDSMRPINQQVRNLLVDLALILTEGLDLAKELNCG